jgi:release factor glutamine methyltransferase
MESFEAFPGEPAPVCRSHQPGLAVAHESGTVSTFRRPGAAALIPRRIWRLPGVYRPQDDTWLLASTLAEVGLPDGASVLDFCTGTGALAMAAARSGAAQVTAVDTSARAVATARANAWSRRLPIRTRRGGFPAALRTGPFDVVLANPPYVPCPPRDARSSSGVHSDRWDAGHDGRAVLDPLCGRAPELLRHGGFLLLVQSSVAGTTKTLTQLREADLVASIAKRERIPFGPVMRSRAPYLVSHGLCPASQDWEDLVVIRADKP